MLELRVKAKAKILIREIPSKRDVESIVKSLAPDNVGIEETTRIIIGEEDNGISIVVEADCKLGSFIHTMDDLLRCLATSLRTILENP